MAALRDRAGAPWGVTASVGAALLPDRPRPAEVTASLRDTGVAAPDVAGLVGRIEGAIRETVRFDAQAAARTLFGDAMPANLLVVGAAYQAGALPVSASAIEWAIELNGVAVGLNVAAFRWGRAAVADPAAFAAATGGAPAAPPATAASVDLGVLAGETRRLVGVRAARLVGYQGVSTARGYVDDVVAIWHAERAAGEQAAFSEAVARGLYRFTAYKDEYEVARLLTDPAVDAVLAAEVPGGQRLHYRLHPPALKALGRRGKIAFGPWMRPVLRVLARGRVLRGAPLDPFGRTAIRRLERALRDDYRAMVHRLAGGPTAESYATATAAARAADLVRGYEDVKLAGVQRYRARLAELGMDPV